MVNNLKRFLDKKVKEFNTPSFIKNDPVCVPHLFTNNADIEIAGFFAAVFAWGNRLTIINKSKELMQLMDNSPYQFCVGHDVLDLKKLLQFKHRTFNTTDLLYFIEFLKRHYKKYHSLEVAFLTDETLKSKNFKSYSENKIPSKLAVGNTFEGSGVFMETSLNAFYQYFFSLPNIPERTKKHIACPAKKSACKRLNMFLRWMVRKDDAGVDFGIWKKISPAELICPIDVHAARVARHFNLLDRRPVDWQSALQLTNHLRALDAHDPVKYDFALFGLGVVGQF